MTTILKASSKIKPLITAEAKAIKELTIFDATYDNKGKGIKASDLLKILKKIS